MPKVFISYSQDSEIHKKRVKDFADFLISKGIDIEFDQYTPSPQYGWPEYMVDNIEESDFVLCVCTEEYKLRFENKKPVGKGKGAKFEGRIITDIVFEQEYNSKFLPIIFDKADLINIPRVIHPDTYYNIGNQQGMLNLYAKLTNQSIVSKPKIGEIVSLDVFRNEISELKDANKDYLESLYEDIYLNCISKFKSNGVVKDTAKEIIDNDIMSNSFDYITEKDNQLKFIVGEFGSGKTYTMQILCLKAIKAYLMDKKIPLFINASQLEEKSLSEITKEKNISSHALYLFVDGLDEISYTNAEKIINELSFYLEKHQQSICLISSRPTFLLAHKENVVYIKDLSDDELNFMLEKLSGQQFTVALEHHLGKDLSKTIRNPFFAIIYAITSKKSIRSHYRSKAELIRDLIAQTLGTRKNDKKLEKDLQLVAALYVDNNMSELKISEVENKIDLFEIIKTGYFTIRNEKISFNLPIIAQWFATNSIRNKIKNIDEIISSDANIIRWRYSLSILFNSMTFVESQEYMTKIVENYPGIASMLIEDGINIDAIAQLPSPIECGNMLYFCMEKWVKGLGALSRKIAPMDCDSVCTVFINTDDERITIGWSKKLLDEKVKIVDKEPNQYINICNRIVSQGVSNISTWPWLLTFKHLKVELKEKIEKQTLFTYENQILKDEYFWDIGRCLTNKGTLFTDDISIKDFEQLERYPNGCELQTNGKVIEIDEIKQSIAELKKKGIEKIHYSTLKPDMPYKSGWIWSCYSDEQLYKKGIDVYKKALAVYENLKNNYAFGNIAKNLPETVYETV